MNKVYLRKSIFKKMIKQNPSIRSRKSKAIYKKLLSSDEYSKANNIFSYVSKKEEVDTHKLIKDSIKNKRKIYAPLIKKRSIAACRLKDFNELMGGKYGILEPPMGRAKEIFDLIIVPGIVFDLRGCRIGRGKGHFDRFLCRAKGKRIALAFDFQIVDKIDNEKHDMFVDKIVTEKRVIDVNDY